MEIPVAPDWSRSIFTVGVTGTNGKTTTTTLVAAALRALGGPVLRATTLGYFIDDDQVDVERDYDGFIEAMRRLHAAGGRRAAIELTSEALGMGFSRAWPCTVGVFTNLTHDHLDAHGSPEHYLASKAQLFLSLSPAGTAVLNGCDESSALIEEVIPAGVRVRRYGVRSRGEAIGELEIEAERVEIDWDGTRVFCTHGVELATRAIGEIHAENLIAAYLGALSAGVSEGDARRLLANVAPPAGRFEVVHRAPYVVVDYAHSPDALARTLATARTLADREAGAKVTVVFGAGGRRDKDKRAPMGEAARAADRVVLTSDNPRDEDPRAIADAIAKGLAGHAGVTLELDRARAIRAAIEASAPRDVVLVAGKGHETEQIVGAERRPFSDVEVARAVLSSARG